MLAILPVSKARTNKFYIYRQCTYIVYVYDNEEVDLENEVEKLKAVKETNENRMMDNIDQAQTRQKKYYK
jgi:hypothetical protein